VRYEDNIKRRLAGLAVLLFRPFCNANDLVDKEMPLGTQIIKAAVEQIGPELEEASNAAGATWLDYFRRILLSLLKPTMVSVAIIVFISAIRDIPTVIFLSTHESRTLSLLMLDYIAEANQEKAAVLGIFLVLSSLRCCSSGGF